MYINEEGYLCIESTTFDPSLTKIKGYRWTVTVTKYKVNKKGLFEEVTWLDKMDFSRPTEEVKINSPVVEEKEEGNVYCKSQCRNYPWNGRWYDY